MKREFLVGLGLESSVVDQIMSENGKDIEGIKSQLKTQTDLAESLKKDYEKSTARVAELERIDVKSIADERDALRQALKDEKKNSEAAVESVKRDYALESVLGSFKFTSEFAKSGIKAKIVEKNLDYADGKFNGIEDVMKELQEAHKDAFVSSQDESKPKFTSTVQGKSQDVTENEFLASRYANNPYYKQ